MFRNAYEGACRFTQPAILYWKTFEGECGAGIGSIVIVNSEGWIVTAAHIVSQALDLGRADIGARQWEQQREAIRTDTAISAKERTKRFAALGTPQKKSAIRAASSWGYNNSRLTNITIIKDVDLAVGKLDPFDPAWVTEYPVFKDPSKNFLPGASLCKLGYPFHDIKPLYDEGTSSFTIPPEMSVLPFFPIEGMFTRTLEVASTSHPFPLRFIETSTPGLRGQSGGPTFDTSGAIWGIQSQTRHLPLGFSPEIKDGGKFHKEHQFLNVGMGVHVETVLGLFNQIGIQHQVSTF